MTDQTLQLPQSTRTRSGVMRAAALGLAAAASAVLAACTTAPPGQPAASANVCTGWTMTDYASARVVRVIRLYTDSNTGDSAMEETTLAPKSTPLMKTGTILREYEFGPASKVKIVAGPADLELPMHPAPGRESFLMLQGTVLLKLANGQERQLVAGDMTVFEDTTASRGHGGKTGPCGYVSLNIVP